MKALNFTVIEVARELQGIEYGHVRITLAPFTQKDEKVQVNLDSRLVVYTRDKDEIERFSLGKQVNYHQVEV